MVLYGYDASVYNSVQGSANWEAYFNHPDANMIGAVNTAYTVGAIFGGFFLGGPIADFLGRKIGMATGCVMVIAATFMQTWAPRGNIACFLAGRCIIGIGQGIALSKPLPSTYYSVVTLKANVSIIQPRVQSTSVS
jgi:MFS family permease